MSYFFRHPDGSLTELVERSSLEEVRSDFVQMQVARDAVAAELALARAALEAGYGVDGRCLYCKAPKA